MTVSWPEPVQRVQLLAESGLTQVPSQYIRPHAERPILAPTSPRHYCRNVQAAAASGGAALSSAARAEEDEEEEAGGHHESSLNIPVLDLGDLEREERREAFLQELKRACEEWGFFHVTNHGVEEAVMEGVRSAARGFFKLPMAEKQAYANDPVTYEGYGSRLGVSKGAVLDWGDYFFLNLLPPSAIDLSKWPTNPPQWRKMVEEYGKQVMGLFKKLMAALSMTLGLEEEGLEFKEKEEEKGLNQRRRSKLEEAFGEVDMGLRINYYPPCPQPELTLGLSSHSDPGGLTLLLQDHEVAGLQVKSPSTSTWVTIPPLLGSIVVNLGDQLQILTNGKYRSVEHRVVVNNNYERLSLACFMNPSNDTLVAPLPQLVHKDELPAYVAMTYKQYRALIRNKGTNGKGHLESIASPTSLNLSSLKHLQP